MELVQLTFQERPAAYQLYRSALFEDIEQTFGWDEEFQQQRFNTSYSLENCYWVFSNKTRVGFVCYRLDHDNLHLHLLVIEEKFRRRGFGKTCVILLQDIAKKAECNRFTLSVFNSNSFNKSYYQELGFEVVEQDQHFSELAKYL